MEESRQRVLRVFFDHGHSWPLWESGSDKYAMEPADYGYSLDLEALLRRWQVVWEAVADYDIGQPVPEPTDEDRRLEQDLAARALAMICRETPPDIAV